MCGSLLFYAQLPEVKIMCQGHVNKLSERNVPLPKLEFKSTKIFSRVIFYSADAQVLNN